MHVLGYGKIFTHPDEVLTGEPVPSPEEFTRVVETLVRRYNMPYFDAILALCEYHDREYESIKKLMTPKLKLALMEEMAQKRMLKDNSYLQDKLG